MKHEINCYLDRFEGDMAVFLVDGKEAAISRILLPSDISEGDYLTIRITIDTARGQTTAEDISELQERLKSRDDESR